MKLRGKLLLVAIVPLVASLALTAYALRQQQYDLARRQAELVRSAATETAQAELRHYIALALSTISPLYNTGRDDAEIKRLAMKQLAQLDYGPDGYFFLYDFRRHQPDAPAPAQSGGQKPDGHARPAWHVRHQGHDRKGRDRRAASSPTPGTSRPRAN